MPCLIVGCCCLAEAGCLLLHGRPLDLAAVGQCCCIQRTGRRHCCYPMPTTCTTCCPQRMPVILCCLQLQRPSVCGGRPDPAAVWRRPRGGGKCLPCGVQVLCSWAALMSSAGLWAACASSSEEFLRAHRRPHAPGLPSTALACVTSCRAWWRLWTRSAPPSLTTSATQVRRGSLIFACCPHPNSAVWNHLNVGFSQA